jgi:hypothetical protein
MFSSCDTDSYRNQLFNIDVLKLLRGQNSKSAFAGKSSEESIRKKLREKLRYIRDESLRNVGHHPLVFTGVGIPYDLDNENAHETGGYRSQIKVMDAYHCALEGSSANGFIMWADMTEVDTLNFSRWTVLTLSRTMTKLVINGIMKI